MSSGQSICLKADCISVDISADSGQRSSSVSKTEHIHLVLTSLTETIAWGEMWRLLEAFYICSVKNNDNKKEKYK